MSDAAPLRYPTRLGTGVFLMGVGAGLIIGALTNTLFLALAIGAGAGAMIAIVLRRRQPRWGTPTRTQIIVVMIAVAAELVIFFALNALGYPQQWPLRTLWLVTLAIVAVHFIPMRWSHGPHMLALAALNLAWIAIVVATNLALPMLAIGDGAAMLVVGALMAAPLLKT